MRTVLAGDLGGTKCRFALIGADYGVHFARRVDTVRELQPFLDNLTTAIEDVLAERDADGGRADGLEPPAAVSFGTAGIVRPDGRSILEAPNLPIGDYPLADYVSERFGMPASLLNDGRASAWGEFLRGHAAGQSPLLCLFFGTGIGIGLILDGRPFAGGNNAAGEIGHTVFRPGGRRCPCGHIGHFEAYCGGRAITERAHEELGAAPDGAWTVGDVVAAAAGAGDAGHRAQAILEDAAEAACALVENCCTLLNPSAVVLGGGALHGWPALRERIVDHVISNCREPIRQNLAFVPSMGGSDAVLWGAAAATGALWSI